MFRLGRFLQLVALFAILPVAMVGNMLDKLNLRDMLMLCAAGIGVFYIGYLLQQASRPR